MGPPGRGRPPQVARARVLSPEHARARRAPHELARRRPTTVTSKGGERVCLLKSKVGQHGALALVPQRQGVQLLRFVEEPLTVLDEAMVLQGWYRTLEPAGLLLSEHAAAACLK